MNTRRWDDRKPGPRKRGCRDLTLGVVALLGLTAWGVARRLGR